MIPVRETLSSHVRPPRAQDQRGDLIAGGTAPGAVRAALENFKARLAKLEENS